MSVPRISRLSSFFLLACFLLALSGCAFRSETATTAPVGTGSSTGGTGTPRTTLGGRIIGGQQPISGSSVTLWAAGTSANYGSGSVSVATTTTDASGNFGFNVSGASPCTTGQLLYITSTGGNPGSGNNQYAALMAALPTPCGPTTANTFVTVDEATTVASVTALQQFMTIAPGQTPAWNVGAPPANITGMVNAFTQVGNLVGVGIGTSAATTVTSTINSVTYTTTITPDSTKINTLADILAACINTAGSGTCNSLFTDTTPANFDPPTDTIQAAYYLATNAGALNLPAHAATQGEPYYLCSTYITGTPPFQPYGACGSTSTTYPTDWAIGVSWSTSNGTSAVGTATPYSLAVDGSGNIWTAYSCNGSTGCYDGNKNSSADTAYVTEFNPMGQVQFTPASTTTISAGPSFAGYSGSTAYSLIAGRPLSLAIDTANNAWFDSFYGAVPATQQGVIAKIAPGGVSTGYLVAGSSVGAMAIDGNNNIFLSSQPSASRYYLSELEYDAGAYSTFDAGIGRSTGIYNGVWADSLGYGWSAVSSCVSPATILRASTGDMEAASTPDQVTNAGSACPGFGGSADSTGGAFFANGSLYHVAISGGTASKSAPVVITEAAGTGTTNGGLDGGSGTAVDGFGNVWVANTTGGGVSEFSYNGGAFTPMSPSGTATVPVYGFGTSYLSGTKPIDLATDASGNVWIGSLSSSQKLNLWYLVGVAGPSVTPTSMMLKTGFIGERPGAQVQVSLSPALTFSSAVSVGQPLIATLSNTGTASANITGTTINGSNPSDFSVTGTTCGTTLAIGASCSITVTFSSSAPGLFTAALNVASNAVSSPASIALSGTAFTPVPLNLSAGTMTAPSVPSLTFPTTVAGNASPSQTVVLTNSGSVALSLSLTTAGVGADQFTQSTTCGSTVAAGASCYITVSFSPTAAGTYTPSIMLTDNAGTGTQSIALSGVATSGSAISLTASSLTFTTPAESTSAPQTVTLKNTGTAALNIASDTLTGNTTNFIVSSDTCTGTTVSVGSTCTITVSMTAFLAMNYSGNIAISSDAGSGPSGIALSGTGTGTITLTNGTTSSTDWSIDNGAITLHFNPAQFHVWAAYLDGDPNDLVDTTYVSSGDSKPYGFYMGNQGLGAGTLYTGSQQIGNEYLDVWAGETSSATNFLTYEMHIVVTANDPGYHTYYVVKHSATDIAGSLGLVLWQFRTNLGLFTHSFDVDTGLNNLGVIDTPLPDVADSGTTDPGKNVQNAAVEVSGSTLPDTVAFMNATGRNFYTKYDYSTYEYLHKGQGTYGPQYGAWVVLPRTDTIAGGPTKQDVDTLTDLIQQEMVGAHYDGNQDLAYNVAAGTVATKMYGPIYAHFNKFNGTTLTTPLSLYQDAMSWMPQFDTLYDTDSTLTGLSYVPSTARGTVTINMGGIPAGLATHTAWAVLSDPNTNMQYSVNGYQYWADISANGTATITGVVPGTYRLTVYVLGQWGEFRQDGVVVAANTTTPATGTWVPESFGTTVFTIGTADRSAHEFLHGEDASGNDKRNYWGQFNYWQDFAANSGAVVYYATPVGSVPATNDLTKWNYVHWGGADNFDPPLYGNYWCNTTTDDTTDGYTCAIPAYVKSIVGETGTNGVTTPVPNWQIHFATPANFQSHAYVTLSWSVACAYGSYVVTLNGSNQEIWHYANYSDCMIRSGLSGYTQWFVMQWPTSALNQTVGGDNVLSIGMSQIGSSDDAIRLELSNSVADPAVTGWNDYTYIYGTSTSAVTYNNDAINNP